jgi:hypothetical protein
MCTHPWRPADETASVGAEAVLLEWLAAVRGLPLDGPGALRDWAGRDPAGFCAAFAVFALLDPAVACAAAGWLLGAGVRPDDRVRWNGEPAAPCLAGLAAIGGILSDDEQTATIVLDRCPVWPPPL